MEVEKENPGELLSTKGAATMLDVSPRTLEAWRRTGKGPGFIRTGQGGGRGGAGLVRYRRGDVEAYLIERRQPGGVRGDVLVLEEKISSLSSQLALEKKRTLKLRTQLKTTRERAKEEVESKTAQLESERAEMRAESERKWRELTEREARVQEEIKTEVKRRWLRKIRDHERMSQEMLEAPLIGALTKFMASIRWRWGVVFEEEGTRYVEVVELEELIGLERGIYFREHPRRRIVSLVTVAWWWKEHSGGLDLRTGQPLSYSSATNLDTINRLSVA